MAVAVVALWVDEGRLLFVAGFDGGCFCSHDVVSNAAAAAASLL